MIYIDTKSNDPYINLSTEYYFASKKDLGDTVFLLWANRPTLVVGKFQNTREEINEEYVRENGISVIRRLSGGGTVYHDLGGRQYTVIERNSDMKISFRQYLIPIVNALASMGVHAEISGRNDLTVDGKKISGNAQYKLGNVTVHHGTLLFSSDIEAVVRSTNVDPYKIISKSIKSVRERVTNIKDHLPSPMTVEEFDRAIIKFVCPEGKEYVLTPEDNAEIERIADEKFRGDHNIYGKNPPYSIEKTGRFPGGKVTLHLNVKNEKITDGRMSGDFFGNGDADVLISLLSGCRLNYDEILNKLKNNLPSSPLLSITLEDIAHLAAD